MKTTPVSKYREPTFYFWYSLLLFVFVVTAFSIRALLDTEALPPMSVWLVVHTVTCVLWLAYVPTQAFLITKGLTNNHRTLGWASIGLAIVILISGVAVNFSLLERLQTNPRFSEQAFLIFFGGIVNFAQYAVFYILGVIKRRDLDFHKHMMLFCSISISLPGFNRLVFAFDLSFAVTPIGWIMLFTAVPLYDLIKRRKISRASWLALLLVVLQFVISGVGGQLANSAS